MAVYFGDTSALTKRQSAMRFRDIIGVEDIAMEDNLLAQTNLTATAEETRTLEDYLAEMLRLRVEIDAEQEIIEQLKADNRELKAETRAMLTLLKATVLT